MILLEAGLMPRSRAELLAAIGLGNKYERFSRYIQPLLDAGWMEMTDPNTPRSPNQRYQITELGRAILSSRSSTVNIDT